MKKTKFYGFTLVELIIVVTILVILSTIAFISFQSYTKNTRDSNRLSTLRNLETGLQIYQTQTQKYPQPDGNITISLSGSELSYQGKIGETVTRALKMGSTPKDPLTDENYIYATDINGKGYKLMGYLEGNEYALNLVSQTYANTINRNNPKVTGNGPGILTNTGNEVVTQDTDLYLTGSTVIYKMIIGNGKEMVGPGQELGGSFQTLALNGYKGYGAPTKCPEGFIAVPGNEEFGQPGFCVAKYEMALERDLTTSELNSVDGWNTWSGSTTSRGTTTTWVDGKIVSKAGKYPITRITQPQAIAACKSIGAHLITNNEWMTIARNIESNPTNWSTGLVGSGYISNGVSNNATFGCGGTNTKTQYPELPYNWATKTGPGSDENCNEKRQLTLTNGEKIWDLAGNVWEHVNKANSIDGNGYNAGFTQFDTTAGNWGGTYQWHNTGWNGTGITSEVRKKYGPSVSTYNHTNNGLGNIHGWYTNTNNNVFLRGGSAVNDVHSGVFTLHLDWLTTAQAHGVGFRCAF